MQLPPKARNHPVFHVSELELYRQSTIKGRHQPPPPVEEIEGEANYVVETIGHSRENKPRKRVEYLVFWEGYLPEEATWDPASNLMSQRRSRAGRTTLRRGAPIIPDHPQAHL